jgi:hypothetical protein
MKLQKTKKVFIAEDFFQEVVPTNLYSNLVKKEKPIRYVEFDVDPLACVVKWLESDTATHQIHTWFENEEYTTETVTDEHIKKAEEIRSFFNNSIMLRRLKGEFVSPYMNIVEELNENVCKVNVDHIKILIKLPIFYKESTETRDLFSKYLSLEDTKEIKEIDNLWTFVKKIQRHSKHEKFWRYYFFNSNQNLLCISINPNSDTSAFLDYIISQGPVGIKGVGCHCRQPGHNFYFYKMIKYELYPVCKATD